ncbi:polyisoprenoid diphosphate/phosphate phosphohydrolase PLPP6 [Antechinus flavipes]|uniref:polyisoprenoid diphosphate/phosphate phosphohydrolase PLPP6 n=1 Tax=Antechinus flavipes TaxID=38775 RepID=UPI002235452D|nr:polyisoprenoid diphosphate/phosphate phosphohydrolase PLPP6 [Antechinus flavipes]
MSSPRRSIDGRPAGSAAGAGGSGSHPGSPAHGNPSGGGGSGGGSGGGGGRFEFQSLLSSRSPGPESSAARLRASESPVHRRGSFPLAAAATPQPPPPPLPEEDCMKLNPSFVGIALCSLLAIDLWMSKRLGVCAGEKSSWGSARPLMKLLEISGHGVLWLAGTAYCLYRSDSWAGREVLVNLMFALLLDLGIVALLKGLVRRRRPSHNQMDMLFTFSVDKYSFPSGHATRAALVSRFILHHLVLAIPLRVLIVLWAFILGLSRVMLGRHNVTDVAFGFFLGYIQYSIVDYFWLSPFNAPAVFALWSHQ